MDIKMHILRDGGYTINNLTIKSGDEFVSVAQIPELPRGSVITIVSAKISDRTVRIKFGETHMEVGASYFVGNNPLLRQYNVDLKGLVRIAQQFIGVDKDDLSRLELNIVKVLISNGLLAWSDDRLVLFP